MTAALHYRPSPQSYNGSHTATLQYWIFTDWGFYKISWK